MNIDTASTQVEDFSSQPWDCHRAKFHFLLQDATEEWNMIHKPGARGEKMRLMHSSTWKITVDAEVIGKWYFAGGWLYSRNIWVINLWVNQPSNPRLKSVQGSVQLRWHQVPVIISVGVPKNGDVLALKTRKADIFGSHDIKTHTHTLFLVRYTSIYIYLSE